MAHPRPAVHQTILVVDVEGFGDRRRTNSHQLEVRSGLYRVLQSAFGKIGICWADCHREDRGDGVLVLAPASIFKSAFVESLPAVLVESLREHNNVHCAEEQIRLRMALHAGEVHYDDHGVTAAAVNLAFRILDADALKSALAGSPGVLAVAVSSWFFDEVVRHSPASAPSTYRQIRVVVKETSALVWICLPDHPYPPSAEPSLPADDLERAPRQLPLASRHFVGRTAELQVLTRLLNDSAESGAPNTVVVVQGAPGIGKTTLAVHWAHQVADKFPDGQLYVDLRGFTPAGSATAPGEAIRQLLVAVSLPPQQIPQGLDAQAALYRTLLADRRVLVVLDNARDSDQVRPLLPASRESFVVVTSRRQLTGLVGVENAYPLTLDLPSHSEATELMIRRLGRDRMVVGADHSDELIALCGRLPLALSIVAARAAAHPQFPIAALAAELRQARGSLDPFDGGESTSDVRAAFSCSYQRLNPDAAMLFQLLGLHPDSEISVPSAASLLGVSLARAHKLLVELSRTHLIIEYTLGRFTCHDLLRRYASELVSAHASAADRRKAAHRMLDHFLHTGLAAMKYLYPNRALVPIDVPVSGVELTPIHGRKEALTWFTTEHTALAIATEYAGVHGFDHHAWQLPWVWAPFLYRQGHWHQLVAALQVALPATQRLRNQNAMALAHLNLGTTYMWLKRYPDATDHHDRALDLYQALEDHDGQGHSHYAIGWTCENQGKHPEAIVSAQRSLDMFLATGNRFGQARAMNLLGRNHGMSGQYEQALTYCQHALHLFAGIEDSFGQAQSLDSLGFAHHHLGDYVRAIAEYEQAIDLWCDVGNVVHEALARECLGDTCYAVGDRGRAQHMWGQALTDLEQLGHPATHRVRAKLLKHEGASVSLSTHPAP
jgi:tetratricopeptide (TPR) repeat protein